MRFAEDFELEIVYLDGSIERVKGNVRYIQDDVLYVVKEHGSPGVYVNRELVAGYPVTSLRKWSVIGH